jgi:hypothetical protein
MIQRGLVAAVSLVLALIVITAFRDLLEPPDETLPTRTTTTVAALDDGAGDETTTTSSLPEDTVTTTTSGVTAPAICIDDEPTDGAATVLQVYFPCGSNDLAIGGTYVYRAVAPTDLVLTTTLREMTKGPDTDELALGFKSPLPDSADGSFLGLSIVDGTAYIEFNGTDIFPDGVDTAEGAQIFLSTLNANVFQFTSIREVEYRLNGSCDAFWQQLGSGCESITRADWQSQLAAP